MYLGESKSLEALRLATLDALKVPRVMHVGNRVDGGMFFFVCGREVWMNGLKVGLEKITLVLYIIRICCEQNLLCSRTISDPKLQEIIPVKKNGATKVTRKMPTVFFLQDSAAS